MEDTCQEWKVTNAFYLNEKDNYPKKRRNKEKDSCDSGERFAYPYNPETGRHEGKWLTAKELENVVI